MGQLLTTVYKSVKKNGISQLTSPTHTRLENAAQSGQDEKTSEKRSEEDED